MNAYTPMQTLTKVHRELWWTIRLLGTVEVQLDENSKSRENCAGVAGVLRAMVKEIELIIARERDNQPNPRKVRQGSDLALKAQLAKARQAVAEALKVVPDWPSHK